MKSGKLPSKARIAEAIVKINRQLKNGWKERRPILDLAVGELTARELHQVWSNDRTHQDFLVYMWTFHVSWSFEATWAGLLIDPPTGPEVIELTKELEIPDNFNPDIQLKNALRFAPHDHLSRICGS